MNCRTVFALLVGLLLGCNPVQAPSALADPTVSVRSGDHPGFGRIVLDTRAEPHYKIEQSGDHVSVRVLQAVTLGRAPASPHNVSSLQTSGQTVELTVVAGASVHPSVVGGHLVIDVNDPPATQIPAAATGSAPLAPPVAAQPALASSASPPSASPRSATAASAAVESEPGGHRKRRHAPIPVVMTTMTRSPELAGRTPVAPVAVPPSSTSLSLSEDQRTLTFQALAAPGVVVRVQGAAPPQAATSPKSSLLAQTAAPGPAAPAPAASPGQPTPPNQASGALPRGPVDLLARQLHLPDGSDGSAFILPFAATTGAAEFQDNQDTYIVFDERRPVDLSPLHDDPMFSRAEVRMLAGGTLLHMPAMPGIAVSLAPSQSGWRIAANKSAPTVQPIAVTYGNGDITLAADKSSGIVSIADPVSGATLLVGTTRHPGQAVALARRSADFIMHPTKLGVVVEPLSDALTLKVVANGFLIGQPPNGLSISPQTTGATADALSLTRRLDFYNAGPEMLLPRLVEQIDQAALAPAQARGPKRVAAAVTMTSLGMAAEAQSLLRVAAEQDPHLASSADVAALSAVTALLAGRPTEADGLNDPRLTGSDDIALWRGIRQAMLEEGSPAAAAVFASTAPLVSLYPRPIRDRILPLIAETMIQGGETAAAASLLAGDKDNPKLAYARALLALKQGDTDKALAMLDLLADGHDQFDAARAAVQAVELRLATNKITPAQAADAMDRLVYAWRGDQRELALRQRIAELREQTGEWSVALATLRQAEADFPDQAKQVHNRLQDAFADMVSDPRLEQMPPIDVVSAIDENADLAAAGSADPRVQEQLADRLLALDLPGRASSVLEKLMKSATTPLTKALYGVNLATVDGRENNDAAALAALNASEAPNLPAALAERRTLLRADTLAHSGDARAADALLAGLGTPAASQARAAILERAQDWSGAEKVWMDYAAKTLPDSGTLDDDQARTLVRLATDAARAGDDAALTSMRDKYAGRLSDGALAEVFRLLTAEPVHNTSELQRVRQDISLAQSLPANLRTLYGATPPPKN
jgi:hypothetical protein